MVMDASTHPKREDTVTQFDNYGYLLVIIGDF